MSAPLRADGHASRCLGSDFTPRLRPRDRRGEQGPRASRGVRRQSTPRAPTPGSPGPEPRGASPHDTEPVWSTGGYARRMSRCSERRPAGQSCPATKHTQRRRDRPERTRGRGDDRIAARGVAWSRSCCFELETAAGHRPGAAASRGTDSEATAGGSSSLANCHIHEGRNTCISKRRASKGMRSEFKFDH